MSKQKIMDAAIKLFSELGFYRTSMDDIAKEAGVAKGTLYYHFEGKGQLFEQLVTEGLHTLMREMDTVMELGQPADVQIRAIIEKHVELFLRYSELVQIISNELSSGIEPDILNRLRQLMATYIAFLTNALREGCEAGELNAIPFELTAVGIIGLIESVCSHYNRNKERMSVEEVYETVSSLVLSALLKR